jgi:uncharacterized protein
MNDTLINTVLAQHATRTAIRSIYHGPRHWRQVAQVGVALCQAGSGADPEVVLAFAMLHDVKRGSDGRDPDHGLRASRLAARLVREGLLELDPPQIYALRRALEGHNKAYTLSRDPTIGTCWDADRFTLWRVRMTPLIGGISSRPGREQFFFFQRLGYQAVQDRRPGWNVIVNEYKELI